MLIGRSIPQHMLQNVRDNESADRSCDKGGDRREAIGDDGSKGEAVGGSEATREPATAQKQQEDAYKSQ